MFRYIIAAVLVFMNFVPGSVSAYTHADTLRGSNGSGRSWWDVKRYHLSVDFDLLQHSVAGRNQLFFEVTGNATDSMQIDLQKPLVLDSVMVTPSLMSPVLKKARITQEGNVWWVEYPFHTMAKDSVYSVVLYYHGVPRSAKNPPWDGGVSWGKDSLGNEWDAVSCQGLGASVWWPCKDAQWDEPDNGMRMEYTVPDTLQAIGNGRLVSSSRRDGNVTYYWEVKNPINNYDVTFYIGDYAHWSDTLMGEKGRLNIDYYALKYNEKRAREHFAVVKNMLRCFEYWMGPYPFYEDGYKLVEAPYLGMEHQSAIAYGNKYQMGYKGKDRSETGKGLAWDYIIIHESGHEWFGNNVTAGDMADNWIHEGITSYSESLFTECLLGRESGIKYSKGLRTNIENRAPLIDDYGVNAGGSGDIYEKGAAIMHMIRAMSGDEKFRQMLRGLGQEFYHGIVTTAEVERYISKKTGLKLDAFFEQYLRRKNLPVLAYYIKDEQLHFRFEEVVPGFSLPIQVSSGKYTTTIRPGSDWQQIKWQKGFNINFSDDYLISIKK